MKQNLIMDIIKQKIVDVVKLYSADNHWKIRFSEEELSDNKDDIINWLNANRFKNNIEFFPASDQDPKGYYMLRIFPPHDLSDHQISDDAFIQEINSLIKSPQNIQSSSTPVPALQQIVDVNNNNQPTLPTLDSQVDVPTNQEQNVTPASYYVETPVIETILNDFSHQSSDEVIFNNNVNYSLRIFNEITDPMKTATINNISCLIEEKKRIYYARRPGDRFDSQRNDAWDKLAKIELRECDSIEAIIKKIKSVIEETNQSHQENSFFSRYCCFIKTESPIARLLNRVLDEINQRNISHLVQNAQM
jgi:hypothetical protein